MSKLASFFRNVAGAPEVPNEALLQHYSQQRRALLKRLALAVKQIQLEGFSVDQESGGGKPSAETSHVIYDGKAADHLLYCFEAILEHGLSQSVLSFGRSSFWPLILKISRKQAIQYLSRLRHVTSVHGRCRAWLRLAANENSLQSYILILCQDTELLRDHYDEHALMLDEEQTTALCSLLTGINNIAFSLNVDNPALEFEPTPEAEPSDKLRLAALQLAQAGAQQQSAARPKRRRKGKEKTSGIVAKDRGKGESVEESSSEFEGSEEEEEEEEESEKGGVGLVEQSANPGNAPLASVGTCAASTEQPSIPNDTSLAVGSSAKTKTAVETSVTIEQMSTLSTAAQSRPSVVDDPRERTEVAEKLTPLEPVSSDEDAILVAHQKPSRKRRREHKQSSGPSLSLPSEAAPTSQSKEASVIEKEVSPNHEDLPGKHNIEEKPAVSDQAMTGVQQAVGVVELPSKALADLTLDSDGRLSHMDNAGFAFAAEIQTVSADIENLSISSGKDNEAVTNGIKDGVANLFLSLDTPVEEKSSVLPDRHDSLSTGDGMDLSLVDDTSAPSVSDGIDTALEIGTANLPGGVNHVELSVTDERAVVVEASGDGMLPVEENQAEKSEAGGHEHSGENVSIDTEKGELVKEFTSHAGDTMLTEAPPSPPQPQPAEEKPLDEPELFGLSPFPVDFNSEENPVVSEEDGSSRRFVDEKLTVTNEPSVASSVVNDDFCAGLLRHHNQARSSTPVGSSSDSSDDETSASHVSESLQSHGRWIEASVRNEVLSFRNLAATTGSGRASDDRQPQAVSSSQEIPGAGETSTRMISEVGSFVVVGSHIHFAAGPGALSPAMQSPLQTQLEESEEVRSFDDGLKDDSAESPPLVRPADVADAAADSTTSKYSELAGMGHQSEHAVPSESVTGKRMAHSPPLRVRQNGESRWQTVGEASVASGAEDADELFTMFTLMDVTDDHFAQPDMVGEHATVADLEFAIERRKQRFTTCAESEREELVAEMVQLRLRLLELVESEQSDVQMKTVLGHRFVRKTKKPGSKSRCDRCGATIWRMIQPWYRCQDCHYNCHAKCLVDVSRRCAMQKSAVSVITEICPVRGLGDQQYMCFECRRRISFSPRANHLEARLCDYTGKYYCPYCHWNDQYTVPARVVHNWDFTLRKVCRSSIEVLSFLEHKACLSLDEINPLLFNHVDELIKVKEIREEILVMKEYFVTCQTARTSKLLLQLVGHQHYVDTSHMYSLCDLISLNNGTLLPELQHIASSFVMHIKVECEICRAKGFNCELCSSDETIFHFDHHCTSCTVCHAVYHRTCFKKASCPRCHRRQSRKLA